MKSLKQSLSKHPGAALALALGLGLTACGGGGGGSVEPPPTITATYVAGTAETGAFTVLQNARNLCGFGPVIRNSQLDAASLAHAKYLVDLSFASSTSVISHTEQAGVPGFTGADLGARALAQNYVYAALAEILEATSFDYTSQQIFPSLSERGANSMRNLMNTVYHLSGALYEGSDVGVGAYLETKKITSTTWREEYRFGSLIGYRHTASPIVLGSGRLVTFPCAGSSKIPSSFVPADESPNPFPAFTSRSQLVGPPIYLKVDSGQLLTLTSVSVSKGGNTVPTTVLNNANDPTNPKEIGLNETFVIPTSPLDRNSDYQVTLQGSIAQLDQLGNVISRAPFTPRTFTFTTGS